MLLLLHLERRQLDPSVFEFLIEAAGRRAHVGSCVCQSQLLVELADDLTDYTDDVQADSYNAYR